MSKVTQAKIDEVLALKVDELDELRKDALLGRFVRLRMTECHGGWAIAQTFIPGAPSLEEVTDALDPALIERALAR